MAQARQTPHRTKREVKEVRQAEVQEYRSENQRLRRENARLRRELEKLAAVVISPATPPEASFVPASLVYSGIASGSLPHCRCGDLQPATPKAPSKGSCPECGSDNLVKVKMGVKSVVGCKACDHRYTE